MTFWAASDVNARELAEFAGPWRQGGPRLVRKRTEAIGRHE